MQNRTEKTEKLNNSKKMLDEDLKMALKSIEVSL